MLGLVCIYYGVAHWIHQSPVTVKSRLCQFTARDTGPKRHFVATDLSAWIQKIDFAHITLDSLISKPTPVDLQLRSYSTSGMSGKIHMVYSWYWYVGHILFLPEAPVLRARHPHLCQTAWTLPSAQQPWLKDPPFSRYFFASTKNTFQRKRKHWTNYHVVWEFPFLEVDVDN